MAGHLPECQQCTGRLTQIGSFWYCRDESCESFAQPMLIEPTGEDFRLVTDDGEGAESEDELNGTENGLDEDDHDGGSYYSSERMADAQRIGR